MCAVRWNTIDNIDCQKGMKELNDQSIDLIITSPPYYNTKDYVEYRDYDAYKEQMRNVFTEGYRVLKEGRMCAINISTTIEPRTKRNEESKRIAIPFHFVVWMEEIGFKFIDDIIWEKPEGASKNRNGTFSRHRKPVAYKPNIVTEYIFIFQKPFKDGGLIDKVLKSYDDSVITESLVRDGYERSNIWRINPENKVKGHSAPYPLELPLKLIEYYSFKGDKVLDMFMGSGTTAVACKRLDRYYKGYEIHREYIELSAQRLLNDN